MDLINWATEHGEKLGIVTLLILVSFGLYMLFRRSEKERKECEVARLETTAQIGDLKTQQAVLETKLEVQDAGRLEHLNSLKALHTAVLLAVKPDRD